MSRFRPFALTRILALVGTAAFAAACSSDTAPSASQLDVSAALGAMTVPGVSSALSTVNSTAASADVSAPAIVPSSCAYYAATQSFACPAVVVNGITIQRSYTLFDAQGQPQSAPDKSTTNGIAVLARISGTATMGGSSVTVNGSHRMMLTGLLADSRVLNGLDTTNVTGTMSMGGTSTPFTMNMTTETRGVALPPAGSTTSYPLAGMVSMAMSMTTGTSASTLTTMVLEFTGGSTATLTVKSASGLQTCTVDLTGKSAPVCAP